MIHVMKRLGLVRPWQRLVVVFALSFPLAFAVRAGLQFLLAPDLATKAVAYVRYKDKQPLSEPLAAILEDPSHTSVPTLAHPLLGQVAPGFALPNDRGEVVRLEELHRQGPIALVFYLGYSCTHCVAQLFALNEDLRLFEELGIQVVAISADSPEHTAGRFRKHGRFGFPVLSDAGYRVAQTYGVCQAGADGQPESLVHGTFLIDRSGRVVWVHTGAEPFLDNKTLLRGLASLGEGQVVRH